MFFNPLRENYRELPAATKAEIAEKVRIYRQTVEQEATEVRIPPFMVDYIVDGHRARLYLQAMNELEEEMDDIVRAYGCIK